MKYLDESLQLNVAIQHLKLCDQFDYIFSNLQSNKKEQINIRVW
jgi:hypothetical protein